MWDDSPREGGERHGRVKINNFYFKFFFCAFLIYSLAKESRFHHRQICLSVNGDKIKSIMRLRNERASSTKKKTLHNLEISTSQRDQTIGTLDWCQWWNYERLSLEVEVSISELGEERENGNWNRAIVLNLNTFQIDRRSRRLHSLSQHDQEREIRPMTTSVWAWKAKPDFSSLPYILVFFRWVMLYNRRRQCLENEIRKNHQSEPNTDCLYSLFFLFNISLWLGDIDRVHFGLPTCRLGARLARALDSSRINCRTWKWSSMNNLWLFS